VTKDADKHRQLIVNMLDAFAYHQIVTAEDGKPVDYVFLEINRAFEEMTGLAREKVIGKKVTEVLPGIEKGAFDWIAVYGRVALSGEPTRFVNFSEPLGRWYEVSAYSDKPGYFATVFHDITGAKKIEQALLYQNNKLKLLLDISKAMAAKKAVRPLSQIIVDGISELTGLGSAAIYLLDSSTLKLEATYPPLPADFPEHLRNAPLTEHSHVQRTLVNKQPVVMADSRLAELTAAEKEVSESRDLRSQLFVPLVYQAEAIGVLIVASNKVLHDFTEDEIAICQALAGQAALSVKEACLTEQQKHYLDEIEKKNADLVEAEEALRVSEERLDLAMAVKNEGIWDVNLISNETYYDDRYYTMAGYQPGDFPQDSAAWEERVHEEDLPLAQKAIENHLNGKSANIDVEYRFKKKDGQWMWLNDKGKVYKRDESGKPVRIVGTHTDITDRKLAEEKLKKIEWMLSQKQIPASGEQSEGHDQGYGDLTALNRDGLILKAIGPEFLRSFSNDYLELLGTSSAIYEVNGDYAFGIFASGWCRMMDKASRNLCDTPDNVEALNSGRWLCHESCWTDCSKEAILKREQVEIECNGGIRLYAVPIIANGEVVGAINFGYGDPPEDREKLQELADTYQVNYEDLVREAHAYETRPPYIIEMAKNRLHATARLIGSMIEKKQAEEEIRTLNKELEQRVKERTINLEALNKELASFAYSISHDFRAPLRALDAFSANLNDKYGDQLDEQGRHFLNRIRNNALYMSDLIDDLLKLSRITRAEVNPQEVDISRLAGERIQLLQEAEPERRIEVKIAAGLSAQGDRALLHAALQNLLENAWKFSAKEEQAEIEVGHTTIDGEEVFFVRDNGVGFNMAYADKLFGTFQRLHGADEFPGTGIGLATVQRIINRHGGKIWAESEVGEGATFFFTLP
jgi:PAS domain S-box-containing protein